MRARLTLVPTQVGMAQRTRDGKLLMLIDLTSPLGQGVWPLLSPGFRGILDALLGLQHQLERALAAASPAVRPALTLMTCAHPWQICGVHLEAAPSWPQRAPAASDAVNVTSVFVSRLQARWSRAEPPSG